MFNGIIKNTGKINKILKKNNNCTIEILSKMKFNKNEIGSSISCSGTCLTLDSYKKNRINEAVWQSWKNGMSFWYNKPIYFVTTILKLDY